MRKVLLFIGLLICAITSFAQVDNKTKTAALQLVRQNAAAIKLPSQDINDVIVSSSYQITGTDVIMVYLQQSYKGIPVYNQLKTLAFRGGKVVSDAGELQPSMEKLTGNASNLPGISPANALQSAFKEAKVTATELAVPISVLEDGRKFQFGKLGVSAENISAELIWIPNARGEYRLAWQVFVAPVSTSDYWLIRVDAQTGTILNKDNLTITCKWDHENHSIEEHVAEKHNKKSATSSMNYVLQRNDKSNKWEYKPFVIGTATYRVVKYPAESPQHPGGTPSLHTDPWTLTPGNATSLKWHSDPVDYNITRGNNVWAQEDRDASNTTFGIPGNSTTPLPNLTFDYNYDFTKSPIDPTSDNQQAAIVNLFYMNNLMHDMAYTYGFDEVAGNFQNDNQGRGGAGVDYVIADAQDASGTNNANFATPADGTRPRMQMFLWTAPNPDRDGDLDNGIVSHEYGHGISNRFTGGPNVVNCLQNSEQGGEGWSDYMSLMMGTNWATATVNDGPIRRGIGTYALNQPITGTGIRAQPYSTDMSIFSLTYANLPGQAIPHGVGTIWCGMIWEMTWEIIKQDNFIEPNFLNPSGAVSTWRGNAAAMKLVMEGMRLQPCSPGFVQARNAILQADQVFFGGRYACSIWKAFAKRGLGRNASQGSNTSITDGVPDFSVDSGNFGLNPSGPSVFEGTPLTYTNVVSAGECTPMTNYVLRDTLPTTVTWVSGGVYTPGDRVVTFSPINLAINTSQNFPVTVNVNAGTYFAPVEHINDPVTAIAPNWTATSTTANVWATSGASVRSAPLAFFSPDPAASSQQILTTTNPIVLTANPSAFTSLSFWHRYVTESGFDGCVVEISTNSGGTWTDLGPYMSGARYNGTLSTLNTFLGGRQAFTGNVGASFVETKINLAAFAGQTILVRFRFASDASVGATGWYIDDILLESRPFVYTKAGLYDNTNTRVSYKDSLTPIIQALCANPPVVNAPTVTQPTCGGTITGTIVVNATGVSTLEYSINGGTTYQASNTFTGLAAGNYDIVVRLQATPSCVTTYSSNPVVINALTGTPTITPPTVTQPLCPILTGTIVVNATGTGTLEYSVNGGTTFQLSNTFNGLTPGNYNIVVREQSNPGCSTIYSGNPVVINTVIPPVVVTQPVNRIICQNGNTTFTITDNAPVPAPTYQWQISTNGGTTWTNLANVAPFSGVTTTTLTVTSAGLVYNGNLFRCVVQNICGPTNSNSASLTVNPLPTVNSGPSGLCAPVTLTATGNADTYAWTPSGGLNTTTGTTVIATPTVTTVYTVTGTITATGCQNSASVTVLGTPATPAITPAAPVICAGTIQPLTVAPTTFTVSYSGAALTIPGTGTGTGTGAPASVYPAVVNITGLPTSGVRVKSIAINGLSHTFPSDVDMVVQSPTGTNVVIMSDAGGGTDIVNGNLVFDDAAASLLPATIVSGTYRPTNAAGPDAFPAPGPGSITQVNPPLSNFTGNFNGNWNLFVVDDIGGDAGSLTSWTITFEVPTAIWSPATGLYADPAATVPYVAGTAASTVYFLQSPAVTTNYTYTVTNTLGTCSSGPASVTVTVNPVPTIAVSPNNQCGPVTLTATGNSNSYSWSPAAGLNTTTGAVVIANPIANTLYTVTGAFTSSGCTSSASVTVNATPPAPIVTPSSVSLCLGNIAPLSVPVSFNSATGGAITINASGNGTPYPSTVNVTGVPAGARVKSVNINGFAHTFPDDVDILLQSPSSTNVVIMSDVGGGTDNTGQNFVFDDAAGSLMSDGALNSSGTYRPTNYVTPDTWAAPGPGAITQAVPTLSSFTGNMNGTWSLFVVDDLGGDGGSIASWSITFEVPGPVWSPATGLFTNAAATIPYVAGTQLATVYASPATTTTYSVNNITPTCTSPTTTVTVTIYQPIAITTQPANQTVCAGATVTFSVATTGNFQTYQWQLSTDNGATWTNISGANATSYVVANTTTALSGRRYRVIITNSCNTVTSNAATLTVNAIPTVVANDLFSRRICISDTLVPLIGTPVGGSWSGIGVSGFNFIPGATAVGTYTLTYSYTNTAGCSSTDTTTVKVSDCPERIRLLRDNAVILFPNPNNGQFNIRMNSVLYNYLGMKVYTAAGQLVHTQQWSGLVYGRVVPINLTHLPAAVYMVRFVYDDGIRTSEKTFKVVVGRQ